MHTRIVPTALNVGSLKSGRASQTMQGYVHAAGNVIAETLWPTYCVLCSKPGMVLCNECRMRLDYIDQWKACPVCGAPFGFAQCTECNSFSLAGLGRTTLPYQGCVSAVSFNHETARIVAIRKDSGERRLAIPMAYAIACAIPPNWIGPGCTVTYIPSTKEAQRRRGFCHAKDLAKEVAALLDLPCQQTLLPGASEDQRILGRKDRAMNVLGRFHAIRAPLPKWLLIIDDVYTTGSTAMAATDALTQAGCTSVYVATFAHVT